MNDFFSWLEGEAPGPVVFSVGVIVVVLAASAVVVSAAALSSGYWMVPLVIWIILPAWFVARSYIKSRKGKR